MTTASKSKQELRSELIARKKTISSSFAREAGRKICLNLSSFELLSSCRIFTAFYPVRNEPDILSFVSDSIRKGLKVCFPRYNARTSSYDMACPGNMESDFVKGRFGIPEPLGKFPALGADILKTILWIVPGLAFDCKGTRLGHGKGIFDRLLADSSGIKIGICYNWQLIDSVPSSPGDEKVDFVVTEEGISSCRK